MMDKEVQAAYTKAIDAIANEAGELGVNQYREYLDEIQAHVQCLIDCWEEENKEDDEP